MGLYMTIYLKFTIQPMVVRWGLAVGRFLCGQDFCFRQRLLEKRLCCRGLNWRRRTNLATVVLSLSVLLDVSVVTGLRKRVLLKLYSA